MNKKIQSKHSSDNWKKESPKTAAQNKSASAAQGISFSKVSKQEKIFLAIGSALVIALTVVGVNLNSEIKESAPSVTSKKEPARILNLSDKGDGSISFGKMNDNKILEDNSATNYYSTTAKDAAENVQIPKMVPIKNAPGQSTTTAPRIIKIPKNMDVNEFNKLATSGSLSLQELDFIITREEGLPENLREKYKDAKYPIELSGKELFAQIKK